MGCDTKMMTSKGFTAIHIASEMKDVRILDVLLQYSEDEYVSKKAGEGVTPIMGA